MYHAFKNDPWGNKVPVMSTSQEQDMDAYVKVHPEVTAVVRVPRSLKSIIMM